MSSVLTEFDAEPPQPGRERHARGRRSSLAASVAGVIGEILITAGLVLGLYVVWQLWWTDVEAEGVQADLSEEFIEKYDVVPDQEGAVQAGPAPIEVPELEGTTFARLWVTDWGSDDAPYVKAISEGVDRATVLDVLGIGHYPDTAMPGETGNFSLAAHRQSHGAYFYDIETLDIGDSLIVETGENWYVYRVTNTRIVLPTETSVIAPNPIDPSQPATTSMITLTTCHPLFTTRERYIVHGELESWMPRDSGRPAELLGVDYDDV